MNHSCKTALAVFLNFAFLTNQIFADLPLVNFDTAEWIPLDTVGQGSQAGWQLISGTAKVSAAGEGFNGGATGKALKIPVNLSEESHISRAITWNAVDQTAFIDFQFKPAADPVGSLATFVANGTQLAFQLQDGDTKGQIWVLHGADTSTAPGAKPEQWIQTAGSFDVPAGATTASNFVRITMRHDYLRNLWDLFIDGKLAAANLAFDGRGSNLQSLDFYGSDTGNTFVDDLSAKTDNMLFPDADKDGLSDAWELANGSNPNLYDRDSINPATGKSFLDSYMASLWNLRISGSQTNPISGSIPQLTINSEAPHQAVGSLKGALSVGGDGSASYSIPIDIPKGTGGMEPKLSLGYSSNSGNGVVGVGWNLSGLQRITRGPSSAAKDGTYDPMDFDGSDRFFLDGERLVCVSGTYGAAGSEYRTEIDSYARITAIGAGPASWQIETKAGLIVTLGGNDESKTTVPQGTLSWGVTKVKDTVGNYYTVDYARDVATSEFNFINHRVSQIRYTGNEIVGTATYCSVDFLYENRSDISRSNTTYAGYRSSKRLAKILVNTGPYVNHSYRLGYESSYQTGRSLLKSVTKYMRDLDTLVVPSSNFSYAGLQAPSDNTFNPLWQNPGPTNLPVYGTNLDATDQVNSVVTVEDPTTIKLVGDVSRAYVLPGGIPNDTDRVQFDFYSPKQVGAGAMIGVDSDKTYQGTDQGSFYRIGGTTGSSVAMGGGLNFGGTRKDYSTSDGWRTYTVAITPGTARNYLVLMCVDNDITDGVDSAFFRNVKIYKNGNIGNATNVTFDIDQELPRYSSSTGKDLGVVSLDINGDGLPDLSDWRAYDYDIVGGALTAKTDGNVFINNGEGFTRDNALRPPTKMPLGVRSSDATAYGYNDKHSLLAQSMDIDGDGRLDLMESSDIRTSTGFIRNGYTFHTLVNGVWTAKTGWDLPFIAANDEVDSYGGKRRFEYFQWVDLNSDGYQDLILQTNRYGELYNPTTGALTTAGRFVDLNTSVAYLNKGKNGPGWTRSTARNLPETLLQEQKDIGRRLVDLNGDGIMEITEALAVPPNKIRHTYFMNGSGSYLWNSNPGLQDPPPSPRYDIPDSVAFVDTSYMNRGAFLTDLNGDGLVDLMESNLGTPSQVWINRAEKDVNAWKLEPLPQPFTNTSTSNYNIPFALQAEKDGAKVPYGYEMADLNGDGLVDILYSSDEDIGKPGTANRALLNTGNGWLTRENWGLPASQRFYNTTTDRTDGKRRAKLQDINGDGFPDLITGLIDQTPKVWFNQCKPEVLIGVVDGMGTDLNVSYKRLNDPTPTDNGFKKRVYEKGPDVLPAGQVGIIDSRLVVSSYSEPNGGNGINRRVRFQRYGDLRYDRINESSLGFGWIEAKDGLNNQLTHTDTKREFPFGGSPVYTETTVEVKSTDLSSALSGVSSGTKVLSQETADYAELPSTVGIGGTIRRPVQQSSVKILRDLTGTTTTAGKVVSQTTTTQFFDNYGFVTASLVSALDGTITASNNTYVHTTTAGRWFLGRLDTASVTKSGGNKPSISKNSSFTYDPDKGLLKSETIQPAGVLISSGYTDSTYSSVKSYEHDAFGNVKKTTVATSGVNRDSNSDFGTNGRFLRSETNQLGQRVAYTYNDTTALLTSTTSFPDPGNSNGKTTRFEYDNASTATYGTLTHTYHPDGTETGESTGMYADLTIKLPSSVTAWLAPGVEITHYRAKQTSGTPVAIVYLDRQGKELVAQSTILKDATASSDASRYARIYTVTRYDGLGRKVWISEPFGAADTPQFTTIERDVVGRVSKTTRPDGQLDEVILLKTEGTATLPLSYSSAKNHSGSILERWEDQNGRLIQSKDASGQITVFEHDHEGRILKVTVGGVLLLTNTFDILGNKTSVTEANSGTSSSTYNALGEVVTSTNAKGQTTSSTLDLFGRPTTVTKPEGTYTTSYFTSGPNFGKPQQTSGPGYSESITSVDGFGRPLSTSETIGGETFTTAATYDALGRVLTETDAGGLTVVHEYDPKYSFPVKLSIAPGCPGGGKILWRAGIFDSKGRPLTQTLAQGVTSSATYKPGTDHLETLKTSSKDGPNDLQNKTYGWDTLGNLTSRADLITKRSEGFGYDSLNRVISATATATGSTAAGGNTVPAAASFGYDTKGNLTSKAGESRTYPTGGNRPHAVTAATIKGAGHTYQYDAAGYMTFDKDAATGNTRRSFTWTSFGQLLSLDYLTAPALQNFAGTQIYAASRVETGFTFDAGGNRLTQTKERKAADQSAKLELTTYLGAYEREIHRSKAAAVGSSFITDRTVHRHNIGGFAVYTTTKVESTGAVSAKLTTILKDHLGSTDVLYTGTWNGYDFANPVKEFQSFDPWGERRSPDTLVSYRTTDGDAFRTSGQDYDRGYTGHEQLDDSGLIHMNGRIYDPELGRMLSPDPYVQVPEYSQNFNRYSYVMNNPLNLTDPTGFSWMGEAFHDVGGWLKENWRTVAVIVVVAVLTLTPGGQAFIGGVTSAIAPGLTAATWTVGTVTVSGASVANGVAIGSIAGGLGAGLSGGNLGDVLRAATVGAISGAITAGLLHGLEQAPGIFNEQTFLHIAGHGVLGGATNAAMGGKFQDGFISAAVSAAAADAGAFGFIGGSGGLAKAARTVVAGVVGGTASALGGGKFANGAWTASFQHLLNREFGRGSKNANPGRGLTEGEKKLLRENFGNAINVESIKIFNYAFLPGMRVSTPNGSIYAPGITYSADYSKEMVMGDTLAASQAIFIHEATHAYQYQQGVQVKTLRLTQPGKHADYNYHPFSENKKYADYGIEQQAMLVEDHFRVMHGAQQVWGGDGAWHAAPSAASLNKVIPFN